MQSCPWPRWAKKDPWPPSPAMTAKLKTRMKGASESLRHGEERPLAWRRPLCCSAGRGPRCQARGCWRSCKPMQRPKIESTSSPPAFIITRAGPTAAAASAVAGLLASTFYPDMRPSGSALVRSHLTWHSSIFGGRPGRRALPRATSRQNFPRISCFPSSADLECSGPG